MADVVGAVASALTLLDSTVRVLNFISKLKDVPIAVQGLTTQAKQLEEVLKDIQSKHALIPNHEFLQRIVQNCMLDLSTFDKQLQSLARSLHGKTIPKAWAAVKGVVEMNEYEEAARKIDRHKTTLQLFLQIQTLLQVNGLAVDLSTVQHGINSVAQELPQIQSVSLEIRDKAVDTEDSVSRVANNMLKMENSMQETRNMMRNMMMHLENLMMKPAALAQEVNRAGQQGWVLAGTNGKHYSSTCQVPSTKQLTPELNASHTSRSLPYFHCSCHKTQVTAWRSPYGFLNIGTIAKARHRRDCPWASLQRSFQVSIHYRFPWDFLKKVVHLSFATSYGARAYSLAPYLGIISVATSENPAIDLFERSLLNEESIEEVKRQLWELFDAGKASPSDINMDGLNLVHIVIRDAFEAYWDPGHAVELIKFLKDCGTNVDSVDYSGQSPLGMYFQYSLNDDKYPLLDVYEESELEAARMAIVKSGATVIAKPSEYVKAPTNPDGLMPYARRMIQNLRVSEEFAEDVLRCGPLSMAVLQRSETQVRYHLQDPSVLNELNAAGHSPLHLCGDWAQGVEILLKSGFPCDKLDSIHLSPLDYAISMQDGADAASILLKFGSPLTSCDDTYGSRSTMDLALRFATTPGYEGASQSPLSPNIAILIANIKWRRVRLAELAQGHLPRAVLVELQGLGTAIDHTRAQHTWRALENAGVKVPPVLDTRGVFVYHEVRSKSLAISLYNMGFKCLDEYDQYGTTPLMKLAWLREREIDRIDLQLMTERLRLAEWYLLKVANPLPICQDHDIRLLHIAAFFGTSELRCIEVDELRNLTSQFTGDFFENQWFDPLLEEIDALYPRILSPLLLYFVQKTVPECQDSCCCGCSPDGCTPTTKLLAGIADRQPDFFLQESLRLYEISAILYNWYKVLAVKGVSVNKIMGEVRRFIAFSKLDLTHTCCKIRPEYHAYEVKRLPEEDVEEIRREEDEFLTHLENMLQQPDSDWWKSPSTLDILLDVNGEGSPPTLRWANLWLVQRTYGLDEEACEAIRIANGLSKAEFWESKWEVRGLGDKFESWELPGSQNIKARPVPDTNHHLETAIEFISS